MMAATLEDDDRSAVVVTRRRTKIVATLGPVSRHEGVLERLLEAGMDVARINLSHGSTAEHALVSRHRAQRGDDLRAPPRHHHRRSVVVLERRSHHPYFP